MGRKGTCRLLWCGLGVLLLLVLQGVQCEHEPTESECRPYIERALKEHHVDEAVENDASSIEQEENSPIDEKSESNEASEENKTADDGEATTEDNTEEGGDETDDGTAEDTGESVEGQDGEEENKTEENEVDDAKTEESSEDANQETDENATTEDQAEDEVESNENDETPTESADDEPSQEGTESTEAVQEDASGEEGASIEGDTAEVEADGSQEGDTAEKDDSENAESTDTAEVEASGESQEAPAEEPSTETAEEVAEQTDTTESTESGNEEVATSVEDNQETQETTEDAASQETVEGEPSQEAVSDSPSQEDSTDDQSKEAATDSPSQEDTGASQETAEAATSTEATEEKSAESGPEAAASGETTEASVEADQTESETAEESESDEAQQEPVEELTREAIIPANLRPRDHITQILKLDEDSVEKESALAKTIDTTLHTLKKLYDNAIKPLEILYKYRDLSNRHFGDPEIFSKPLILFMGPWSGGKSSTINYLLDLEFTELALRTGAEPSPAYFNILTYGEETEILDGTQLAADWTFSGLQKFGQGLLDRLRGVKLKSRLLEKVNIVEIPGILEIRKQVQRLFPFNDACQWFIDRADIIFLVYDPAKLDVGPETEAILDQLKGREYQTRIVLNKADQVKPEELMRVQGTLIWNISPLMSSQEPPVMYTTSLWSLPYETNAPTRLLIAQERAFLRDLREAIDKRVENKIASARRFAVRVRNHAKMVDCYLTTYYNHKTFFGNKRKVADDITETPQKYHIYEGLSTLTNISRYDLPDPEMYRDFFRINNLYDFTKLSDTCTYFRGCPINKLDIAIAYDLPELVGKYKKAVEQAKTKS